MFERNVRQEKNAFFFFHFKYHAQTVAHTTIMIARESARPPAIQAVAGCVVRSRACRLMEHFTMCTRNSLLASIGFVGPTCVAVENGCMLNILSRAAAIGAHNQCSNATS